MAIIILILDLCAPLSTQMNTQNPVAFSSNIHRTEWAVNYQTSRGQRACGLAQTVTITERIKVWYAWQNRTERRIWNYNDYRGKEEHGLPVSSSRRQKTAIKFGLIGWFYSISRYKDKTQRFTSVQWHKTSVVPWKLRDDGRTCFWSNYGGLTRLK